jgi:hypothetical protein
MPAESSHHRNGSERSVPNGSKPSKGTGSAAANDPHGAGKPASDAKGRTPVLDDEQLLAASLADRLGRPPKLEELISEAGGCQRQRASRILQKLREHMAAKVIRNTINLPADLESEMKGWMVRCLSLSAQQLAAEHARLTEQHEQERAADKDLVTELQTSLHDLREALANQTRMATETIAVNRKLEEKVSQLRAERDIAQAVADDRLAIIEKLRG